MGLNDESLFRRLFDQRNEPNERLLFAAEACALVYSFQGEDTSDGDEGELSVLGALVGLSAEEMYRSVAALLRRGLVQKRGVWRAVLPPAVANRLAATALQDISPSAIAAQIVEGGNARLFRSLSKRLGLLHRSDEAVQLVAKWLRVGGVLGDVTTFNDVDLIMFCNVASANPEATLAALERVTFGDDHESVKRRPELANLVVSIAYDPVLFTRSARLAVKIAELGSVDRSNDGPSKAFESLFFVVYSGTHASVEQRLEIVDELLRSGYANHRALGIRALAASLETSNICGRNSFEFGSRSRDYGAWPASSAEEQHWFSAALQVCQTFGGSNGPCSRLVRNTLADKLQGLWLKFGIAERLETICRDFAEYAFWPEGWIATRETLQRHAASLTPDVLARIWAVEGVLRPKGLVQKVRSLVLADEWADVSLDEPAMDAIDDPEFRLQLRRAEVQGLGRAVANDAVAFGELSSELTMASSPQWTVVFGVGLAEGTVDPDATWRQLVAQLAVHAAEYQGIGVLRGFLTRLQSGHPEHVDRFLVSAVEDPRLVRWFPLLQTSVPVGDRGADRLARALQLGNTPIQSYSALAYGRAADSIPSLKLKELVLLIASDQEGFSTAAKILQMRFHSSETEGRPLDTVLRSAGRTLLERMVFIHDSRDDYELSEICRICVADDSSTPTALTVCRNLRRAVAEHRTHSSYHKRLLERLFRGLPNAALDGLCGGNDEELLLGTRIVRELRGMNNTALLDFVPEERLLGWCDCEPSRRYTAIASVVAISRNQIGGGRPEWTPIAMQILERAANRLEILERYADQWHGMNWGSFSRAATMDSNATLWDALLTHSDPTVAQFANQQKVMLNEEIAAQRRRERVTDRTRDERFE